MFAASKTDSVSGAAPDGQFNYVTMLLHGDGTNGAQNNTFLDSGPNTLSITRNGNTTQGSFSPYGSNWSNFFGGSSDYLQIADSSAFTFGSGDFTVEFWIYSSNTSLTIIIGQNNGTEAATSFDVRYNGTTISGNIFSGGDNYAISESMSKNAWHHVAFVRNGTSLRIYVDGVSTSSTAVSTVSVNDSSNVLRIGASSQTTPAYYLNGYLSNVRIVKGTAVYTSNFTPSTTSLTAITNTSFLTCQSNRFIDNSASPLTSTVTGTPSVQRFNPFGTSTAYSTSVIGGSGYFDGSGDSLTVAASSAFAFGTGDFSVQFWVYFTAATGDNQTAVELRPMRLIIGRKTNNKARIYVPNTDQNNGNNGPDIPNNAWTHFSVARTGTTMYVYINGVSAFSFSSTDNFSSNPSISIGRNDDVAEPMIGYVSDVRILKGTYDVTLPTAPYTAITNTSLLLSMTNGAIFDNAMMNDLETAGNAQISTSVKKYGTGSLAFDGTGDYLIHASGQNVTFGTGNFTIEGWFYWNSLASESAIMWGNGVGWTFYIYPANKLQWGTTSPQAGANLLTGSTTLATGQWYHIAVTRASNTLTLWVNGVSDGTVTDSNNYSASGRLALGISHSNEYFNGYMDDVRITKGFARYTTTFTPPTSALSDTGPY
jgi:hypothetical protein